MFLSLLQKAQGKIGQGGGRTACYPMQPKPGMGGMPGMGGPDMGGPGMMVGPGNGMGGCPPGSGMGGPGGMSNAVEQWVQEQNANLQQQQQQQQQQAMAGMPGYPMTSMGPSGPGGCNSMCGQGMMGPGVMGPGGGGYPMVDSMYEFNPDAVGPGGSISMPHMNLSQNKVPNESLTSEQLKHRSEKIGQLSKIKGSLEMHGLLDGGELVMGGQMTRQQQQSLLWKMIRPNPPVLC